jgi:hypothetical protein
MPSYILSDGIYQGGPILPGGLAPFPASYTITDAVDAANSRRLDPNATTDVATPHVPGAWVQLDASLAESASGIAIKVTVQTSIPGSQTSCVLEIGTGGAGSEVVWASVACGYLSSTNRPWIIVPGFFAAGTRVSLRARSVRTSFIVSVAAAFMKADSMITQAPTTYNFNGATSQGLALTAPGSLNIKGAWTQIVAATAVAHKALCMTVQGQGMNNMAGATNQLIDIGIGSAGNEVVIIPDIHCRGGLNEDVDFNRTSQTFWVDIPAGSRLSARYQRSEATQLFDMITVCA